MPLNYLKQKKISPIISKIKNTVLQTIAFIRPDIMLGIFLLVAIILAFLKVEATNFYIVFAVFIVGYFAERIVKVLPRK